MEEILELLKYLLPSAVVFLSAYLVLRAFMRREQDRLRNQRVLDNQKMITPVRLQAYERMTLFLERISPESIIMRNQKGNLKSKMFHTVLVSAIRSEFEHNLSQQIYVSAETWQMVRNAKENMLKLVNTSMSEVPDDSPAIELSKMILGKSVEVQYSPTGAALKHIKKEVGGLFG
jgi:hypothetical protein